MTKPNKAELMKKILGGNKITKTMKAADWKRLCDQMHEVVLSSYEDEAKLRADIDNLEDQIGKLEEQLTMSVGVIKYLELQIARSNTVRSDKNRA